MLSLVKVFAGAKSRVKADTQIVVEKKIQAKCRIGSSADGLQRRQCSMGRQPGNTERKIKLLRWRGASQHQNQCECHHNKR